MDDNKISLNEQKANKSIMRNLIINNVIEKGISANDFGNFAQDVAKNIKDPQKLKDMKEAKDLDKNLDNGKGID